MLFSGPNERLAVFLTAAQRVLYTGLLLCTLASTAHAQQPDSLADSPAALLRTVVIQATRTSAGSPVPHTNLSAAKIAAQYQAQDVPFLLSGVPSLVETSDAGAGVGYTGLRIRGSDPTRVNVTLNGVPLNDAESQGVFWVNLPDLAASAAEIQVQRGVGSSTNGAGAFGATVNIDLSRMPADPFATLTGTVGSFGLHKQSLYVGTGQLARHWVFTGRLSSIQSDGYVDRASADLRSYHLTGGYADERQSLQLQVLSGHERTYQAWYGLPAQYLDVDSLRRFNPAGTERPGSPHPDEVDDYTQRHFLLHYKRQLGEGLFLQLNGHYTRGFGFFEQYKANETLGDYTLPALTVGDTSLNESDLIRRRWLDNHFYGATWALRWQPSPRSETTLGGALSEYRGKHFGEVIWAELATAPLGHRYYDNDATKRDWNVFLKNETRLNRRFTAWADLQVRRVAYSFLGFNNLRDNVTQEANLFFFNPKVGVTARLNATGSAVAYSYVGVGNREPNRDDYTQSTPASRPRAERLLDVETGLRLGGAQWSATANLFGMWYRDQLVLDGRINDVGAYIRTNVPASRRLGVELEGAVRPVSRLQLSGNLCLSSNQVQRFTEFRDNWATGEQEVLEYRNTDLAFSPRSTARAEVGWQIFTPQNGRALSATLIGKHVGRQFLDNTGNTATVLPAFRFADLRVNFDWQWAAGGPQVALIASVQNLFDARYVSNGWVYRYTSPGYDPRGDDPYTRSEGGDTYHQAGFFPQAGRNFLLTAQLKF